MNKILLATFIALTLSSTLEAKEYSLELTYGPGHKLLVNGTSPGPVLTFTNGEHVIINVTNNTSEDSSVHWHGLTIPSSQDGVPGLSFDGIKPKTTFKYEFDISQSPGTYWYHSHSGLQEQRGVFGGIVILGDGYVSKYASEEVIIVSDWVNEHPLQVFKNLKSNPEQYKTKRQNILGLLSSGNIMKEASERLAFAKMRMDPTDITDILADHIYVNGKDHPRLAKNKKGKVLLRIINAAAANYFDLYLQNSKMRVVAADGNLVVPFLTDSLPIAIAETYDVEVDLGEGSGYVLIVESRDRRMMAYSEIGDIDYSSYKPKEPRLLRMADVMDHSSMGDMSGMDHSSMGDMSGMDHSSMGDMSGMDGSSMGGMSGMDGSSMGGMSGMDDSSFYDNLRRLSPVPFGKQSGPVELVRLTGDMNRYIWSINDEKYAPSNTIRWKAGEYKRVIFRNETMMNHPMHLHGMWMRIINKNGDYSPNKHTIDIPPKKEVEVMVQVDNVGRWAFHCHIMYHMAAGMFREVEVK